MFRTKKGLQEANIAAYILIAEDDPDQMNLFIGFAQDEVSKILESENTTEAQKRNMQNINVIRATNIHSLEQAAQAQDNVLLAILDCNMPDTKGGIPHDQFVKTGHRITGQHQATNIVIKHLPNTPITMISAQNRFQKLVTQYYQKNHDLAINFIRKKDLDVIQKNIAYYLRQHLKATNS